MNVSVIICTWNRAELLRKTLQCMCGLTVDHSLEWELIVVDNGSSDDTADVVHGFKDMLPLVYAVENRPGKSYAANTGVELASGDLVVWTDDDVLVNANWLNEYVSAAERWSDAVFFAGAIDPWFEKPPPPWVDHHLARLRGVFVSVDYGSKERPLKGGDSVFGANMAFRTEVAKRFPFDPKLGRIRGELIGADDTDLVRRVMDAGLLGIAVPSALVRHFVPATRLTKAYVWKWFRGAGRNFVLRGGIENCTTLFGAPRWAIKEYFREWLWSYLLWPAESDAWFESFITAARLYGVIQESVAQGRTRRQCFEPF